MESDAETSITEITLQPDGRIYVFGLSREVLTVLHDLAPPDHPLHQIPLGETGEECATP